MKWRDLRIAIVKRPFVAAIGFLIAMLFSISAIVYYFEKDAEGRNITGIVDSIWWGIVTLLTVGYGDRFPVTLFGRLFAIILMLGGVLGIAIVTAKVSSYFLEKALLERKGVCGHRVIKRSLYSLRLEKRDEQYYFAHFGFKQGYFCKTNCVS